MPAPRPVYCRKTEQVYPSAWAASEALSIFRPSISRAASSTAAGRYMAAGDSQWAFADQIPDVWPQARANRKKRTEYSEGFLGRQPVVSIKDKTIEHFPMVTKAAFVYLCAHQLISRAAKRTRKGLYALAEGRQWAYLSDYEEEGFEWPKPTERFVCVDNRRVMSSSLECFDNIYEAAASVHGAASGVQKAINLTLEGVYYYYRGEQWVWASVFNKPDYCWPFPGSLTKSVFRSDGESFASLSEAARSVDCASSAICKAAQVTSMGVHITAKGYQWAYCSEFERPGFEWPDVSTRGTRKYRPARNSIQ